MSYLNRVFAARFFRTLLLICCIAVLIAAIWLLGPFFGFGESRPMQSVESRIIFILLVLLCLLFFWLRWPLFILTAVALCAAVWILTPFVLVGEGYPLAPTGVRLAIIGAILFLTLLYGLWRLLLALKDNPALFDRLTRNRAPAEEADTSEAAAAIASAVEYVNKHRSGLSFFQRVVLARRPIDLLPWYMVLGTRDAGKTSLILASGQSFPVPEQLNQVGKPVSPTRSCECWFANDAVYVDTAGKYVSEHEAFKPEWKALLKALRKHRPVKALNGVIVSFSAGDLLGRSKPELFELAASLRARLDDLRLALGVRFPVYVVVTRLDQLSGFAEYFRILTEQEREQVWGVTFPWGSLHHQLDVRIKEELLLLEKRIDRDIIVRQQEEYDNGDRKRMYALPQDFHLLSGLVAEVVQNVFFASRYDESQSATLLRGIYFTSSHQPVDFRLLNNQTIVRKWSNYVENRAPTVTATRVAQQSDGDFLINDVAWGRQYFLRQLFSDVIVKDAGLARHNLANASTFRLQRLLGHTLCIGLTFILLNGFSNSFRHNDGYLDAAAGKVAVLRAEVHRYVSMTSESPLPRLMANSQDSLLPRLLMLSHGLPEFTGLDPRSPTLDWRYGLYTGGEVVRESGSLYHYFLQRLLLPQLEQQATLALQAAIDAGDSEQIYRCLRLYLQTFGEGKTDRQWLIDGIIQLWESSGRLQPYQERHLFIAHLNNLLDDPQWRRYGQKMDDGLVKYARALLEKDDLAGRLYQRIRDAVVLDVPNDLTLSEMAKSRQGELFTLIDDSGPAAIPGLYTRAGYVDAFKKKMDLDLILMAREDAAVLGKSVKESAALAQVTLSADGTLASPLKQQILTRYLDDYARLWQGFLSNIRIRPAAQPLGYGSIGISGDIYLLRALGASDSPLANLVLRAVKETSLVEEKESKSLLDNLSNKGQALNNASKVNLAWAAAEKKLIREHLDSYFFPLREFATGKGGDLNRLLAALNEQYTLFVIYDDALKNGAPVALSETAQKLSAEAQTWPEPLPNLVAPLLDGVWQRANEEAIAKSNQGIEESIGKVCRSRLQGRYPFADEGRDVKLADFERFFAADGLADAYFKKHLADRVDTREHPWRYKGESEDSEGLLVMFEKAAEIREVFFQGTDGRRLALDFTLSVPYLDPALTQLNMNFDGTQVNYAHWPVAPVSVSWPKSRMTSRVAINAAPNAGGASSKVFSGPWSLFRWLDSASDIVTTDDDEMALSYTLNGRRAEIKIAGLLYNDRPLPALLKDFRCAGEEQE